MANILALPPSQRSSPAQPQRGNLTAGSPPSLCCCSSSFRQASPLRSFITQLAIRRLKHQKHAHSCKLTLRLLIITLPQQNL